MTPEALILAGIEMIQKQFEIVDNVWVYFAMVSMGVLGFALNTPRIVNTWSRLLTVQLGYVAFCVGNWIKLEGSYSTLIAISARISQCNIQVPYCDTARSFGTGVFDLTLVGSFYSTMVMVVLVGTWIAHKKNNPK